MTVRILALLTIGTAFGLDRPVTEDLGHTPSASEIDFSQVKPLERPVSPITPKVVQPAQEQPAPPAPAWMGVYGEPINETLKAQLGLESGIVLRHIAPESPAQSAGLSIHDVIISYNGALINSQDTLRHLVQNSQANDSISLEVLSKGQRLTKSITLAAKPADEIPTKLPAATPENRGLLDRILGQAQHNAAPPEQENRRSFGRLFGNLLKEVAPNTGFDLNFQSTSSVKMMDESGSVEVQTNNGNKSVTVRDRQGNVQYEGPWNTEEEQQNAPSDIRDRVNNIDFSYKNYNLRMSPRDLK